MKRTLIAGVLLTLPASALGYELIGKVWHGDDIPVPYTISDYVEDSLPEGYTIEAMTRGYDAWLDAECSSFRADYQGTTSENTHTLDDYWNHVSWDDPGDKIAAGVLAVTYPRASSEAVKIVDGTILRRLTDADIIFNDRVDWATQEQLAEGSCFDETSVVAVATHEIGHLMGLDHTCEENDACQDQDDKEATMYWSAGSCDDASSTIGLEDIRGAHALYGPGNFDVYCSNELAPGEEGTVAFGVVPFTLRCQVVPVEDDDNGDFTWYFGDGATGEGDAVDHEYTTAGNFSMKVCHNGVSETCGEWESCKTKTGYVRACDVPEAEFTFAHVDGLTYELQNDTDVSVYGCIFDIQWDIFAPDGSLEGSVKAWEPRYTFETEGSYRVVLNVGGPAGTGAAELMIDVKDKRGDAYGCASVPLGIGGFGLLGLGLIGAGVRRRR